MSKKNFAKKFVAYTMAFAVAFGTVNVSPIFVKDAQAAEYDVTVAAAAATVDVAPGIAILDNDSIVSDVDQATITAAGGTLVTLPDLAEAVGMKGKLINPGVAVTEDQEMASTNSSIPLGYDNIVVDGTKFKTAGASLDAVEKNVLVDIDTLTLETGVAADDDPDTVDGFTWYKLIPATGTLKRTGVKIGTDKTTDETITFNYYLLKQVNTTGDEYSLEVVTDDELGLYLAQKNTVSSTAADNYKLFNVIEDSKLEAAAEHGGNFYAKDGEAAKLVVNATSNKKDITYTWSHGADPEPSTTNVCEIEKVDGTTKGIYSCIVDDGVKSITIGAINLATYPTPKCPSLNSDDAIAYKTIVNCLEDSNADSTVDAIAGGKITLTACVPQSDDYVYVWDVPSGEMLETDVINYSASNNSITVVDDTKDGLVFSEGDSTICYVLNKAEYEAEFGSLLEKVALAKTDVEKYNAQEALRDAEIAGATAANLALFKETFVMKSTKNAVVTSEVVVKNVGESLTLTAPEVTLKDNEVITYDDPSASDELGTVYSVTELYPGDFGTERFYVGKTVYTEADTFAAGTFYVYNSASKTYEVQAVADAEKFNELKTAGVKLYTAGSVEKVAEKFVNIVYTSDLELSAENITAKIGSKATLQATATSKLPVDYTWQWSADGVAKSNMTANTSDHSKTVEFTVKDTDIYVPADVDTNGNPVPDKQYALCTAFNGIERKTVKVLINQAGGFTFVGNDEVVYKSTDNTSAATDAKAFNVFAIPAKDFTLEANVTPVDGTELTYAWYKGSVAGTPIATEKSFTTKEATINPTTGVVYNCVVTEKGADANTITLEYTVKPAAISAKNVAIEKIPAQVYNGNAIEPEVKVSLTEGFVGDLVKGEDYTVKFENNINTGTARVIVTLTNKLGTTAEGITAESTFAIDRAENEVAIANVDVKVGEDVTPVVTKNLGKGTVSFTFYKDAACTEEVEEKVVKATAGTYYVVATAIATANYNEAKSEAATVKVSAAEDEEDDDFVLGKTASIKAATTKSTSIKLAWEAVEGADAYRVYVYLNGAYKVLADDLDALTFTAKDLTAGKKYVFAVKAFKDGKAAATFTKATLQTAPGVTSAIKVGRGYTSLKLTWNAVTGATGYRVYVAQDGKWVQVKKATTAKTFTKTGLKSGASYKFAVRAYRIEGSKVIWADTYKSVTAKTVKK